MESGTLFYHDATLLHNLSLFSVTEMSWNECCLHDKDVVSETCMCNVPLSINDALTDMQVSQAMALTTQMELFFFHLSMIYKINDDMNR